MAHAALISLLRRERAEARKERTLAGFAGHVESISGVGGGCLRGVAQTESQQRAAKDAAGDISKLRSCSIRKSRDMRWNHMLRIRREHRSG